jgi:hypothetical protein
MLRRLASAYAWCRCHREALAAVGYYVPAAAILLWALVVSTSALAVTTNADGLWVASFAHDILAHVPIRGWQMSALTLYFPELASVLTWQFLGLDINAAFLLHGVLSWLLIGVATCWGLLLCGERWAGAARTSAVTLLLYVILHHDGALTTTLIAPFSHGGALLCAFLGMTFIAHGLQRGFSRFGSLVAMTWLGLTLASNRGVLGQFVAPTAALAVVFWILGWAPRRRLAWALGVLGAGVLMGFGMTLVMRKSIGIGSVPLGLDISWSASMLTLRDFARDMSRLALDRPVVFGSVATSIALIALRVGTGCAHRLRAPGKAPSDVGVAEWWLCCSSLTIVLAAFGVLVATHWWAGMATVRYVLPILMLPPAVAVMVVAPRMPRLRSHYRYALELTALAVGVVVIGETPAAPFSPRRPFSLRDLTMMDVKNYTAEQACLDQLIIREPLHAGYANYWYSRPTTVLGQTRTTVVELDGQFNPRRWLNNAFWYTRGYWPVTGSVPRYDFVIVTGMDSGWVFRRFGEPRLIHKCFSFETWVYDRPGDIEFRNFIRSEMALQTGDRVGWWESPDLPRGRTDAKEPVTLDGKTGLVLHFEQVAANLIEVVSPTRQSLTLSYRRGGEELASQGLQFPSDFRRIEPLPTNALGGFDELVIRAAAGAVAKVSSVALMTDAQVGASPNRTSGLSESVLGSGD